MMLAVVVMMMMTRCDDDKIISSTSGLKAHLCICSLMLLLASVAVAHTVPVASVIECEHTYSVRGGGPLMITIMQFKNYGCC
jgi:hypothetical protein